MIARTRGFRPGGAAGAPSRSTRRTLLKQVVSLSFVLSGAASDKLPPVRAITRGPRFHWFGYYDKLQFDPTGRYVLGMEVDFEDRPPRPDDVIRIGMIDLGQKDRWIELGESRAWNWQQGCMLQWLPRSGNEVIWNDREGDQYVARILNVASRKRRTVPAPIGCVSPDGVSALALDFRRLGETGTGYGYPGIPDPNREVPAPQDSGVWRLDLRSGEQSLILSLADAAGIPNRQDDWNGASHWFNFPLFSPDGRRFALLHHWRKEGQAFAARLVTATTDGRKPCVVNPYGKTYHMIWRDARHLLEWGWHPSHGQKFYLHEDCSDSVSVVAPDVMTENGHCSYLRDTRWILCDTYPDAQRNQNPYLYDTKSARRYPLGHFYTPPKYRGEWRCDTHPRSSADGRKIVIDSAHEGNGRQLYLIDASEIVR